MSLRALAESDLAHVLEDSAFGFGYSIAITDPDGKTAELVGFSNDISQLIDPDTGQAVSGRLASAVVRVASLTIAGLALPSGIADATSKPWQVAFDDINGKSYTFKVAKSNPDRAIGVVSLLLETYTP